MFSPLANFLEEYKQIIGFLKEKEQFSLVNSINHHFRKLYLLYCSSYYEKEITDMIKQFISTNSNDDRVLAFITNKAIERQYHTYFNWEKKNINQFLGLFGAEFKDKVSNEIKSNDNLSAQAEAFLAIGKERNMMVHQNFLDYQLGKTFEELVLLNEKTSAFIEYLRTKF